MKLFFYILAIIGCLIVGSLTIKMCKNTADTAYKEYSPSALLKKYEQFKDLSAAIDKKRADIQVYETNLNNQVIIDANSRFYYEQTKAELMGLISSHNGLCGQYNSMMSKFNYRFTNKGDLPSSNLEPLPREIRPYITEIKFK